MLKYVDRYQQIIMPDDKKQRQAISAGFTILWVIVLLVFGLSPAVKGAFDAQNKILSANSTLDSLNTNLANLTKMENKIEEEESNQPTVLAAVPETPKAITAVNEIDLAVAVNSLILENLVYESYNAESTQKLTAAQRKEKANAPDIQKNTLKFELQVRGNYQQIGDFMSHLEGIDRLVEIEQITLRRLTEKELGKLITELEESDNDESVDTSGKLLRLNLDGIMYFLEPENTIKK